MHDSSGNTHNPLLAQIQQLLGSFVDPESQLDLASMDAIKQIDINQQAISIQLELGYPIQRRVEALKQALQTHLQSLLAARHLNLEVNSTIAACAIASDIQSIGEVKNIIAVASGKGGVGKSATTVNLALALKQEGANVGILDADIYGPSLPLMMGIPADQRPEIIDQKFFVPIQAYGLQTMSMGYIATAKTPMVWRGPMVSGALMQMINQTYWNSLDYLLIDMPPGTGDIQLTLAQQIPCSGSVIVTTPQNIALQDAQKGIEMFKKVGIPCFGIVENMAVHHCAACGHEEHIFGADGGERIAKDYNVPLLGSLPLDSKIREGLDVGKPIVETEPESVMAEMYRTIARKLTIQVFNAAKSATNTVPEIVVCDD